MCVRVCVCVCTTDTATQILLLLLLLPLSYIAPPSQLFQEELGWRNTSRKHNSSPWTHGQMNSFRHHSMCLCLIYSTNPLPILGLEGFRLELLLPIGAHLLDICGSHFPKQLSIIFSHIPPQTTGGSDIRVSVSFIKVKGALQWCP